MKNVGFVEYHLARPVAVLDYYNSSSSFLRNPQDLLFFKLGLTNKVKVKFKNDKSIVLDRSTYKEFWNYPSKNLELIIN